MSGYRFATMRKPRPWPLAPLARRLGIPEGSKTETSQLVLRLGIDRRNIKRYRRWGLTTDQADTWARRADLHPAEVWPLWRDLDRLLAAPPRALLNAARDNCSKGHPFDGVNARGERTCSLCLADAVRRYRAKKNGNTLVTQHITEEAS